MDPVTIFEANRTYVTGRTMRVVRRFRDDERGSATAEQIVMIGAAVVGAAVVATIIWQKMQDGANNVQTPAP
jgi:hypothetical protein